MKFTHLKITAIIFPCLMILAGMLLAGEKVPQVLAQGASTPTPMLPSQGSGHSDCIACHSKPNLVGKFTNGETISLYFDDTKYVDSVHGKRGLGCRTCHSEQSDFPHPLALQANCILCHPQITNAQTPSQDEPLVFDIAMEDPRSLSLELNQACKRCHGTLAQDVLNSDHARIMDAGNPYAPVCMDCHGSHDVKSVNGDKSATPQICARCHLSEYTSYESSVHGTALRKEANPEVPTCGNCHGTHIVSGPDQPDYRAGSISICSKCHTDESIMRKYGISTQVLNTYLDDFHGRTIDFLSQSEQAKMEKVTCYDCHGVHNIMSPENEASMVYPANILRTCKGCHPDAGATFPQEWLSHRVPDRNNAPVLYGVAWLYKSLIATMLGGFGIYIGLDARRRLVGWKRSKQSGNEPKPES